MRARKTVAAGFVAFAAVVGAAGTASAAPAYDCLFDEVCLYYNSSSYGYGAYFAQSGNIPDYSGRYFKAGANGSSGAGISVKNNAGAVDNRGTPRNFYLYYNSNYDCSVACITVAPGHLINLSEPLKNDNASGKLGASQVG
ncbi:hypothetical protein CP967_17165 [Streptomyces nitrosporeus]|uniref:Peptidase inhibitor family I36 n=1 Tax=Streptomyces nitrosporeus TaxID=28894 RepID=A0A5J6FB66_9ACTN|nr:hypothetical protein [Streptomyces nitrosporeus]QEU73492.1 hypothetical protein CP967_17165 [Streptomyces nitrosporeus]GGZ04201.1 hypothetical protein GCM10010327_38310 [Streptomyces nitrosporeus]